MMSNPTTFYIVRHGQTVGNANNNLLEEHELDRFGGTKLTEKGQEEIKNLAKQFAHIQFDAIFSSQLERAKQSANIFAQYTNLLVQIDPSLQERFHGSIDGKLTDALKEEIKQKIITLQTDNDRMAFKFVPDMESGEEVALRLLNFIKKICKQYPGKKILVVTHGIIMRSFLTLINYARFNELPSKSVENAAYFILKSDGNTFTVLEIHGIHKRQHMIRII